MELLATGNSLVVLMSFIVMYFGRGASNTEPLNNTLSLTKNIDMLNKNT